MLIFSINVDVLHGAFLSWNPLVCFAFEPGKLEVIPTLSTNICLRKGIMRSKPWKLVPTLQLSKE